MPYHPKGNVIVPDLTRLTYLAGEIIYVLTPHPSIRQSAPREVKSKNCGEQSED